MKHICKCNNEIEDVKNPNAIEIQWTGHYGCDECQQLIRVKDTPLEEKVIQLPVRKKSRF